MSQKRLLRHRIPLAIALIALATGTSAFISSPASAGNSPQPAFIPAVSSSFTDSASPTRAFGLKNGPYQVGMWQSNDGVTHESKAYFTFDLSAYHSAKIDSAAFVMDEASVADCSVKREVALWQTATPPTKITWNNAPAEQKKIFSGHPTAALGCPWSYIEIPATSIVSADIKGTGIVTVEVSTPPAFAADPSYARALNSLSIELQYDNAPAAPTNLTVNGDYCGTKQLVINTASPVVHADLYDQDADGTDGPLTPTVEVWPAADPDLVQTFTGIGEYSPSTAWVTLQGLTDGTTYVMKMKSNDGELDSPWSPTCRFGVDLTGPANAPTVTSTDYPEGSSGPGSGGTNEPGTFTFSAGGDTSVVSFDYYLNDIGGTATPNKPGGTATVSIAPAQWGDNVLQVAGVDRAGNRSPFTTYEFQVTNNAPTIVDEDPDGLFKAPRTISLTPTQPNVVGYTWSYGDGGQNYTAANADGTAEITVTPDEVDDNPVLTVQSVDANGIDSGPANYILYASTTPTITSTQASLGIGVKGTFTFTPAYAGIVSYTYSFDNGTSQTIAANANGKATVHWTPTTSGLHELTVTSLDSGGLISDPAYFDIEVNSNQPTVSSTDYPNFQVSGAPGQSGSFTFTSNQTSATSFVYQFGSEAATTVPVAADGTATVAWTPQTGGFTDLTVYSTTASGTKSDPTTYYVDVTPYLPSVTYTNDGPTYTFTVTSTLPGATQVAYTIEGGNEQTAAVGTDGTATFTVNLDEGYVDSITLRSTTDSGLSSDTYSTFLYVD